jgi:putative MFS transporter
MLKGYAMDATVTMNNVSNIAGRLERLPLSNYHRKLFLYHEIGWILGSIGLATTTFLLSPIGKEFSLSPKMTGLIGTMSFLGMFISAGLSGILGDKFGRKTMLLVGIALWGIGSFLLAWSPTLEIFYAARVLLGLGMGTHFPMTQSMLSEIIPSNYRGRYISLLEGGWPIAFLLGGILSYLVLQVAGWRTVFFIQGLGSFYFFWVRIGIPESPRWFETVGNMPQAKKVIEEMEHHVEKATDSPLPDIPPGKAATTEGGKFAFLELWTKQYRLRTIMIWTLWFTALFGFYSLTTWMSALLVKAGFTVVKSAEYVILISLPGIPGYLSAAFLVDKLGRKPMVAGYMISAAVACYFYGNAANFTTLVIWGAIMQFFMFGMWSLLYTYSPELYPTRARATGCGFASSLGRLGALIGPFVVGAILETVGTSGVFSLGAAMFLLGAVTVLLIGPETRGKTLEEINR